MGVICLAGWEQLVIVGVVALGVFLFMVFSTKDE